MAVIIAAVVIITLVGIFKGDNRILSLLSLDNIVGFIAVALTIIFIVVIGLIILVTMAGV